MFRALKFILGKEHNGKYLSFQKTEYETTDGIGKQQHLDTPAADNCKQILQISSFCIWGEACLHLCSAGPFAVLPCNCCAACRAGQVWGQFMGISR